METSELEWHKHQAEQIRETERAVRKGEQSIAFHWWQVGERLNAVYGFSKGGGSGPGQTIREGNIPFLDMEEITGLYGVSSKVTINKARQFHKAIKNQTEALRVIEEYGTWTNVTVGFLAGRSADEAKKRKKDSNAKVRYLGSRAHIMNVDDDIRDELIDSGLSDEDAREAIRLFIRQSGWRPIVTVWKNRENLSAWQRMKAG